MTDDLIQFIRARFDEDEQWALAASKPYEYAAGDPTIPADGVHWEWVSGDEWKTAALDPALDGFVAGGDPVRLATREQWPSSSHPDDPRWQMRRTYCEDVQEFDTAAAGHIARHDPARILREVEAKRHLLEQADLRGRAIRTATLDGGFFDHILRVLALPYSDHPDYRSEWRP